MYGRRSYRSPRRSYARAVKPVKYSNETFNASFAYVWATTPTTSMVTMIPAVESLGMRKVKNFTLSITQSPTLDSSNTVKAASSFMYALVYLPDGVTANTLSIGNSTAASLYEPNQNVIASGVCSSSNGQFRLSSRLARNLNSGDRVVLLLRPTSSTGTANDRTNISVILNYSITY
uniref:Putative ORF1 n=2 Tax=Kirkoviridae TaxID=3152127 RepID=A0A8G1GLA3_9VIRU|nr:putative ORF1 [Po-Circo-like virus 51]QZA75077.1 putative ORF1 [Po-Circo-like virus 51]